MLAQPEYIRLKTLLAMVPFTDRTIYNMEKRGAFPKRIRLGARSVMWDKAEVLAHLEKCKGQAQLKADK